MNIMCGIHLHVRNLVQVEREKNMSVSNQNKKKFTIYIKKDLLKEF